MTLLAPDRALSLAAASAMSDVNTGHRFPHLPPEPRDGHARPPAPGNPKEHAMDMKRAVVAALVGQFGHPRGAVGNVAGWVMARRPSNRQRNRWVVSLLDVQPTDRVLEIGFGPGLAIAELSRRVGPAGHVYGIDRSDVMLRQATRRNAAAIQAGRVTLTVGAVEHLPPALDGPFD